MPSKAEKFYVMAFIIGIKVRIVNNTQVIYFCRRTIPNILKLSFLRRKTCHLLHVKFVEENLPKLFLSDVPVIS